MWEFLFFENYRMNFSFVTRDGRSQEVLAVQIFFCGYLLKKIVHPKENEFYLNFKRIKQTMISVDEFFISFKFFVDHNNLLVETPTLSLLFTVRQQLHRVSLFCLQNHLLFVPNMVDL
jgi:hypothetical protein